MGSADTGRLTSFVTPCEACSGATYPPESREREAKPSLTRVGRKSEAHSALFPPNHYRLSARPAPSPPSRFGDGPAKRIGLVKHNDESRERTARRRRRPMTRQQRTSVALNAFFVVFRRKPSAGQGPGTARPALPRGAGLRPLDPIPARPACFQPIQPRLPLGPTFQLQRGRHDIPGERHHARSR